MKKILREGERKKRKGDRQEKPGFPTGVIVKERKVDCQGNLGSLTLPMPRSYQLSYLGMTAKEN